jgi:hypothetical protein
VVGRELHTLCPTGEDHWGDERGSNGRDISKGCMKSKGFRRFRVMMIGITCRTVFILNKSVLFLMSYILMMGLRGIRGHIPMSTLRTETDMRVQMMRRTIMRRKT